MYNNLQEQFWEDLSLALLGVTLGGNQLLRHLSLIALLTMQPSCGDSSTAPRSPDDLPSRILFIGNSLTYTNDLPEMVKAMAQAVGDDSLLIESVAFPNYSLEDHWNEGTALARLAAHKWDLVIMQQGPSGLPESRALLVEFARKFEAPIRAAGARPAIYMVWPEATRPLAYDSVADNYTAAATAVHGVLYPGIRAWQAAWQRDAGLEFYSPDGLHPTQLGSYVVALMIAGQITGHSIVGLPASFTVGGDSGYEFQLTTDVVQTVQQAAAEAFEDFGRR